MRFGGMIGTTLAAVLLAGPGMAKLAAEDHRVDETGLPEGQVRHGTFDQVASVEELDWVGSSNDDLMILELSDDARVGGRSLHVTYPDLEPRGYHDWRLDSEDRQPVQPGEQWTASAWIRYEDTVRVGIEFIAYADSEPLGRWHSGYAMTYGSGDWEPLQATATIPPGCDEIGVRFTGSGKTRAWIDDVRLWQGEPRPLGDQAPPSRVEGWAYEQGGHEPALGRAVVATPRKDGGVYVRWRMLNQDGDDVAFHVYRAADDAVARQRAARPAADGWMDWIPPLACASSPTMSSPTSRPE